MPEVPSHPRFGIHRSVSPCPAAGPDSGDRKRFSATRILRTAAALVLLNGAPPAFAQDLPLPVVPVSVTPSSRQITLTWSEADPTDGRSASALDVSTAGDSASAMTLLGQYALDCDYRLRLSKVPKENGFNQNIELIYEIADNTTGVGIPVRTDTLDVFEPDTPYFFDPEIAGNLGVRFSPTANQPATTLGTVQVTIGGLSTSSSPTQNYFATALNSVTTLSDTLLVQVAGPVPVPLPVPLPIGTRIDTLQVTTAGVPFSIQNGLMASFSEGQAAPGDTVFWSSRYLFEAGAVIRADLEAFEGYHVWRADLPDVENGWTLLGEVVQCEDKTNFVLVNEDEILETALDLLYEESQRLFLLTDRGVHDDFPYRYAVSTFDRGFLGNEEDATFEGTRSVTEKLYPARQARNPFGEVYVVPNPYNERSQFEEGERRVVFANLPTRCSIRIFTVGADYVTTLQHGPGEAASTSPTSRTWNLRSDAGNVVASGIYVYYVDGTDQRVWQLEDGGTEIRPEPVRQYGKLIIAR